MNITNRTPLAGVKLFQSSTYPSSIDLYWRGPGPVVFELSDCPDRGDAYPNFLAHIQSQLDVLEASLLKSDQRSILTAKLALGNAVFFITQEDDVVALSRDCPRYAEDFTQSKISVYQAGVFMLAISEALLATSFSPVDWAWLVGSEGRALGFYDSKIWEEAVRRLPDDLFFSSNWHCGSELAATEVVANDVHPCCA